ncbi:MAG: hypothetical protein PF569_01405 [Candidatus Woesearchaeota archaeon]|nr:hypothetical protein [Candidatus Woesearchaeota archaeon]
MKCRKQECHCEKCLNEEKARPVSEIKDLDTVYIIQMGISYPEDTSNISFVTNEYEAIALVKSLNKKNPNGDFGYEYLEAKK